MAFSAHKSWVKTKNFEKHLLAITIPPLALTALLLALPPSSLAASGENTNRELIQSFGGPYNAIPTLQSELESVMQTLLAQSNQRQSQVQLVVINNAEPNAWSSGSLQNGVIAINRGLLARLQTGDQLHAAIAHELAHLQRQDVGGRRRLIIERRADQLSKQWLPANADGMINSLLMLLRDIAQPRSAERQHFANRLRYFSAATPRPQQLELPPAVVQLQRLEPLYQSYQHTLQQLRDKATAGNRSKALYLTEKLPSESKFWLLRGHILGSELPCGHFQQAVETNPGWFLPWLELADCQLALGNIAAARRSLAESQALLPTDRANRLHQQASRR